MRPDTECASGPGHPDEYGGGGPVEYIEVGLTTAVAAIVDVEEYGRSFWWGGSTFSRLMIDCISLRKWS